MTLLLLALILSWVCLFPILSVDADLSSIEIQYVMNKYGTVPPKPGDKHDCAAYFDDGMDNGHCCVKGKTSAYAGYFGSCDSSSSHTCPGVNVATCTSPYCPTSNGDFTLTVYCAFAEDNCLLTQPQHCWGIIKCRDAFFHDVECHGVTQNGYTYNTGDFCFDNGLAISQKWCGSSNSGGSTVHQDPQFVGFHGQSFQFHGAPNEVFNLISTPNLQVNGHFIYLATGKCDYNDTECWTHPGTYIDQLGFAFNDHQVKMVAGPHATGLHLFIDNAKSIFGEYTFYNDNDTSIDVVISFPQESVVHVTTHEFAFVIKNSDMFFNVETSMHNHELLQLGRTRHIVDNHQLCHHEAHVDEIKLEQQKQPNIHNHGAVEAALSKLYGGIQVPIHGLIGQTWRNAVICGRYWIGFVSDYIVSDLFGTDYYFNFFHTD